MLYNDDLPAEQDSAVEGPRSETTEAPLSFQSRAAFYIDGFNLYHAIDNLADPTLKWLDLNALCRSFLKPNNTLVAVNYFTAINVWDKGKRQRHLAYIKAIELTGVNVIPGTFDRATRHCSALDRWCKSYSEKKTDVGIAVSVIADGYDDLFDVAFLVTADSDHVPMVRRFKKSFPSKKLLLIVPPKREGHARELAAEVGGKLLKITAGRIRANQLPMEFRNDRGKPLRLGRLCTARASPLLFLLLGFGFVVKKVCTTFETPLPLLGLSLA